MSNSTKGFSIIIGVVMIVAMVGGAITPLLRSSINNNTAQAVEPTAIPEPTLPAPPDISQINFDDVYLHPSGLFTLGVPTGWNPTLEDSSEGEVRVSLGNSNALSVIETRIIDTPQEIATGEELSAFFNDTWLGQTWRDYQNWEETNRSVTDEGHVVIDFNLTRTKSNYIARQESWVQDGEIYSVRVVTAENAPEELKFVLNGVKSNIHRVEVYADSPFDWTGYFDNADKHMIRYPKSWEVTDAADGLPATIVGDDTTLLVETVDVALENEDEAINYIENWRSGVEVETVKPIEVDGDSGYEVSYKLTTLDGAAESGLAVMLNGSDNRLHVANGRISNVDVDLETDSSGEYSLPAILGTFHLFPDLNVTSVVGQQFAPVSG